MACFTLKPFVLWFLLGDCLRIVMTLRNARNKDKLELDRLRETNERILGKNEDPVEKSSRGSPSTTDGCSGRGGIHTLVSQKSLLHKQSQRERERERSMEYN